MKKLVILVSVALSVCIKVSAQASYMHEVAEDSEGGGIWGVLSLLIFIGVGTLISNLFSNENSKPPNNRYKKNIDDGKINLSPENSCKRQKTEAAIVEQNKQKIADNSDKQIDKLVGFKVLATASIVSVHAFFKHDIYSFRLLLSKKSIPASYYNDDGELEETMSDGLFMSANVLITQLSAVDERLGRWFNAYKSEVAKFDVSSFSPLIADELLKDATITVESTKVYSANDVSNGIYKIKGCRHRIVDIKFIDDIDEKLHKYLPNGKIRDDLIE